MTQLVMDEDLTLNIDMLFDILNKLNLYKNA